MGCQYSILSTSSKNTQTSMQHDANMLQVAISLFPYSNRQVPGSPLFTTLQLVTIKFKFT